MTGPTTAACPSTVFRYARYAITSSGTTAIAMRTTRTRASLLMQPLRGDPGELRDDLAPVGAEGLLLAAGHEVDVELVDADRLELAQLRGRGLDVAEDAEAVDDLVGDELAVLRPHARVLLVVVELPGLDEVGQVLGDLRVLAVALDQVHDVVRDHRREPARLLARVLEVVGDVARRADDALQLARVAPRLLGRAPRRVHDPLDDHRIGELDDHAVADPPGDAERLRPVARNPHRDVGELRPHPLELQLLAVPLDLAAVHQVLDHPAACLELGHLHGLQAHDPPRRVAAADAHRHAAVRDVLHGRVPAGRDRRVADPGIRHEVAELDPLRAVGGERQRAVRLLPQDVRVVSPGVLEPVPLAELHQLDHP